MRFRMAGVLLALPITLAAQATVTVPLSDPVYRDIDRLVGNGVVRPVLVGQRPFTRREIARIVATAGSSNATAASADAVTTATLQRLRSEYARELAGLRDTSARAAGAGVRDIRAELLGVSAAKRAIPSRPVGAIAADIAPLLDERAGRVFRDGTNAAAEVEIDAASGQHLAFQARPRAVAAMNARNTFAAGEIEALNATLLVRNIAIEAGRDQFVWGQGFAGGLLGSTSGRPLDMIRIFNDTLARWPLLSWLFHAPSIRGSLVFADLGPNQRFPHSKIIAYKLSGNPFWSRFEFSPSVLVEEGGRGAPTTALRNRIIDLIPALQYPLPAGSKSHDQISNKFAGWEYRLHIPEWSGLQLYAEHQFDDMDPRRWGSTLWQDGGHIAGASFARLGSHPDWSAAAEFHHTGLRYYEHGVWTSGITFNRTLLGDPLGPQGNAGYLRLHWTDGGSTNIELNAATERRSGDIYDAREDGVAPHETNFHFVLLQRGSAEWRDRLTGMWERRPSADRRVSVEAGYERVRNFAFQQGVSRNGFIANLAFDWYPR